MFQYMYINEYVNRHISSPCLSFPLPLGTIRQDFSTSDLRVHLASPRWKGSWSVAQKMLNTRKTSMPPRLAMIFSGLFMVSSQNLDSQTPAAMLFLDSTFWPEFEAQRACGRLCPGSRVGNGNQSQAIATHLLKWMFPKMMVPPNHPFL